MKLAEQTCRPIPAGAAPLSRGEAAELAPQIPSWSLADREIKREFRFKDFRQVMLFTNQIAKIVDEQDHHPDLFISYNKVVISFSTHKIGGLSMNDFIMAAKIDRSSDEHLFGKAA